MKVLMMPDLRHANPYQNLLSDSLFELGAQVQFAQGYKRGLPLWRAWRKEPGVRVLHLHWISPYLRGTNLLAQCAYCVRLLVDIALVQASGGSVTWTIHNRVSHESKWPALERWVQRRVAKLADRVIVHARSSLEELRGDIPLPDSKVSIVPHGHYRTAYGPPADQEAARAELKLPKSGRVYLFFGMLRPYKGIERLIEAWRRTASLKPSDILLIAGEPSNKDYLIRLTESAAECSNIRIHAAFVPTEKIPVFFGVADLVVLPFSNILTSGSLLLAMSYGKPIIAPRFGAIVEAVGNADDLLYDPDDKDGLHVSLERSTSLSLCSLQVRTEQMCEGLDWATIADLTLQAYRTGMGGSEMNGISE